jgi:hypothetical protein
MLRGYWQDPSAPTPLATGAYTITVTALSASNQSQLLGIPNHHNITKVPESAAQPKVEVDTQVVPHTSSIMISSLSNTGHHICHSPLIPAITTRATATYHAFMHVCMRCGRAWTHCVHVRSFVPSQRRVISKGKPLFPIGMYASNLNESDYRRFGTTG